MAEMMHHTKETTNTSRLSQVLPILRWLPDYQRSWLTADLLAGATVWAVTIPEGIAYAQLAGVPAQAALFAAPLLLLGYALFGTSRQLMVGATSASAIMLASTVAGLVGNTGTRYTSFVLGLTLLIALIMLLLGVARLGFIKNFLSESVLSGFVFGLALVIAIGQLPKLFSLERVDGNFFQKAWGIITHLGQTNGWTLFVGVLSLAILFLLERFLPRLPASLIAVIIGIVLVLLFHLDKAGVKIVGTIPTGLSLPAIPALGLQDWLSLLPGALGVVLVIYAEHISAAEKFAIKNHYELDANQELLALGISNGLAGLFQGFAGGGSLSRSSVNDVAGARTQVSGLVAAVLIILTLLFLTPLFTYLPEATLGAIIIHAVWGLLDVSILRRYARLRRIDLILALTALFGVLIFDILPGLLLAVILSLILLIYRASKPQISELGKLPGKQGYRDLQRHPENQKIPDLLIVRLDAPLFFANSAFLRDWVKSHAKDAQAVLLDMEASNMLDIPSMDTLELLARELKSEGKTLLLANVHGPVHDLFERSKQASVFGEQQLFDSVEEGVEYFTSSQSRSS